MLFWCSVVEITSSAEKFEKFEGETVELVCEFVGHNFSLFDNPVVWHKMQRLHHHDNEGDEVYNESSQINMMASVLRPFSATKRFKPTFHRSPPTFRFSLLITGITIIYVTTQDANVINNILNNKLMSNKLSITH